MAAAGLGQVVSWYICTAVAFAFIALRMAVKWRTWSSISVEDGFLLLALACLIGDLAIQQHMWNLGMASIGTASREEFIGIMQMIIPGSVLYVTSLWAIKIALVLLYKRLAFKTKWQTVYNVVLVVLVVNWAVIFFDIIFQCYPNERRWSQDPTKECSPRAADINYWITILTNIFSDVIIISLPISMVLKLQMPLKQKLGVAAMFALGFFVVIASCVRAYFSKRNETMLTCTVSMIETAVALVATSLPVLRSLLLGKTSRVGTSSAGRHYELSSSHHARVIEQSRGQHTAYTYSAGATTKASDSEDDLVKEIVDTPRSQSVLSSSKFNGGIAVTTEFQVFEENNPNLTRQVKQEV